LVCAELVDGWRGHLCLHGDCHAEAATAGARHLLRQHDRAEIVTALAAVIRRIAQAEEAELTEAAHDRVGEGRLLPLFEVRLDLLFEEAPDVEAELLVSVGEVHVRYDAVRPGADVFPRVNSHMHAGP